MTRILDLGLVVGLFVVALGIGLAVLDVARVRASGRLRHMLLAEGLGLLGYVTFGLGLAGVLRTAVLGTCRSGRQLRGIGAAIFPRWPRA